MLQNKQESFGQTF